MCGWLTDLDGALYRNKYSIRYTRELKSGMRTVQSNSEKREPKNFQRGSWKRPAFVNHRSQLFYCGVRERERESLTRPMLCFVAWPRDSDFSCPSLSMMMIGVFLLASEWGNERNSMSNQQTSSTTISTSYTGAIISYIIIHLH
jgi:hypothetical protein